MHLAILRRLAIVALIPSLAIAQRSRSPDIRGERAGDVGGRPFLMPRASDLEDHTPVAVLLDKKKKLALADSQVATLKDVAKQLKEKNVLFYSMWDSVRVAMRAASAGSIGGSLPSAADEERMATARSRMAAILRALKEGDDWSREASLKILTDDQKAKAQQYWSDDAEGFARSIRGPSGGGDARAPGGGRPPRS